MVRSLDYSFQPTRIPVYPVETQDHEPDCSRACSLWMHTCRAVLFLFTFLSLFKLVAIAFGTDPDLVALGAKWYEFITPNTDAVFSCVFALFGCHGIFNSHLPSIRLFYSGMIFLVILSAIELLTILFAGKVSYLDRYQTALQKSMSSYTLEPTSFLDNRLWDDFQGSYHCCGIMSSEEWDQHLGGTKYPESCCYHIRKDLRTDGTANYCSPQDILHTRGCNPAFDSVWTSHWLHPLLWLLGRLGAAMISLALERQVIEERRNSGRVISIGRHHAVYAAPMIHSAGRQPILVTQPVPIEQQRNPFEPSGIVLLEPSKIALTTSSSQSKTPQYNLASAATLTQSVNASPNSKTSWAAPQQQQQQPGGAAVPTTTLIVDLTKKNAINTVAPEVAQRPATQQVTTAHPLAMSSSVSRNSINNSLYNSKNKSVKTIKSSTSTSGRSQGANRSRRRSRSKRRRRHHHAHPS